MTSLTNLLASVPVEIPDEIFETLLEAEAVRIERIVSLGHTSADGQWLDQDRGEWVLVLQGAAQLAFEGEPPIELLPGAFVNIPPHRRHRVIWTAPDEPTIWLAVHYR
jgi:cupin 2 domain-containing protein